MFAKYSRRDALKTSAAAGVALGLGGVDFLTRLPPVAAAETQLEPRTVRLRPEIEPLVQFIERTSRDQLLEQVAARIERGLSYQDLLAALLLAGVKNVEPRPSVGFKFHAVLVVNSAHLASMASPSEHRWLPIFWALDYFKSAAASDARERGDWTMPLAPESSLPAAHNARREFLASMDNWDEEAADAAVASLSRSAGAHEIYEMLFRYGARDFRSIGHKAIYVANSYRTLQCIGSHHAEPVLRSLAYALLMHEGENPAKRDSDADRPYRRNEERARRIRSEWQDGKLDKEATAQLLSTLRTGSNDDACEEVVEMLNRGVAPQAVWDALLVGAGELLMRQPGIVALHAVTTANALNFAYQTSGDDTTRRLMMLQCAAFLPMFNRAMHERGSVKDLTFGDLESSEDSTASVEIADIFAELGENPMSAARRTLAFLKNPSSDASSAEALISAARVLVFMKGNDAHDYKFSSAILEDFYHVSPEWRHHYLALNMFKLRSARDPDNRLVERTRAALGV